MAAKLKQSLGSEPKLIPGSGGVFDVVIDDELVYSKFETGSFPDENHLVDELEQSNSKKKKNSA